VLYHWRTIVGSTAQSLDNKSYAATAAQRALSEHLTRTSQAGELIPVSPGQFRIRHKLPSTLPSVSILIWSDDGNALPCIHSLQDTTTYPEFSILTNATNCQTAKGFQHIEEVSPSPAQWFNMAAKQATGEILCLLTQRATITDPLWLHELVSQLCRPGIGAVGPLMRLPSGHIYQAGQVLGWKGKVAGSPYRGYDWKRSGYANHLHLTRNVSALCRECMVMRRQLFLDLEGMDYLHLPNQYYDTDLCLRLQENGLRLVWTPGTQVDIHHHPEIQPALGEEAYMRQRWQSLIANDPNYNPNLSLYHDWPAIALTSRQPSL
jgi:GT2 family glycosyltransferase